MAKLDFFAEKNDINEESLTFTNSDEKFLNLKYGNLYKKDKFLNTFKGGRRVEYRSFIANENKNDFELVKQISGIYKNDKNNNLSNLQNYIEKLPKYSFAIWFKFELKAPYFSKDDDEFYIIQNPILKETNFKVPMIRGSAWKGALAHAFRELFKENYKENREKIESFLRIFGAGSESVKALERYIFDKSKDLKKAQDKLLEFILFELGLEVDKDLIKSVKNTNSKEQLVDILKNNLSKKMTESHNSLPLEFQTHKGRAIFYPTYFGRLSLEVINPHDRRKRAGTKPIHYEVVPAETKGIFQLIYIPFDGILKTDKDLIKDVQKDLSNLIEALKILENKGIGAKTKLGWGKFKILEKKICPSQDLETTIEGWERCQKN